MSFDQCQHFAVHLTIPHYVLYSNLGVISKNSICIMQHCQYLYKELYLIPNHMKLGPWATHSVYSCSFNVP